MRGALSGRVFEDGESGTLSQVRVEIRELSENWSATALTDHEGNFRLDGIPAGSYFVIVNVPGCVPYEETVQIDSTNSPLLVRLRRAGNAAVNGHGVGSSVSVHELSIPAKARKSVDKGNRLLSDHDARSAISEYQRAIKVFPDYYEAYYRMGIAEVDQQRGSEAEAAFRKAIELSEDRYAPAQSGLSLVLCIERHFSEAEAAALATLEIDANDPMGHYALALVMYATGRIPDAEKGTLEALRLRPKFPEAYLLLAQVHARQDNPAAVVADLDAYLRLDGISPRAEKARSARAGAQNTLLQQSSGSALAKINP